MVSLQMTKVMLLRYISRHYPQHSPITPFVRPPGKEGVVVTLSEFLTGLHHSVTNGDAHRHHKEGELEDPIRELHNGKADSSNF